MVELTMGIADVAAAAAVGVATALLASGPAAAAATLTALADLHSIRPPRWLASQSLLTVSAKTTTREREKERHDRTGLRPSTGNSHEPAVAAN